MKKTEHYKQPLNFCKKVGNEKLRFSSCIIFKQPVLSLSSATLPRILSSRMAAFPESQRDLLHCMHWLHHARGTFSHASRIFIQRMLYTTLHKYGHCLVSFVADDFTNQGPFDRRRHIFYITVHC